MFHRFIEPAMLIGLGGLLWTGGTLSADAQPEPAAQNPAETEAAYFELPDVTFEEPVVRLSLGKALSNALFNNLLLEAQRYAPEIEQQNLREQQSEFDIQLEAEASNTDTHEQIPTQQRLFIDSDATDTRFVDSTVSLNKKVSTGGTFSVGGSLSRTDFDDNAEPTMIDIPEEAPDYLKELLLRFSQDPVRTEEYLASAEVSFTQPLLKDFGVDVNRTNILKAENSLQRQEQLLFRQMEQVLADVESAYWELVFAIQDVRIKKLSLKLARNLLRINQARARVGTAPPIDVTETEAEVARREEDLLTSMNTLGNQQDELRRLMNTPQNGSLWVHTLVPTATPAFHPVEVEENAAYEKALVHRSDYQAALLDHENLRIDLDYLGNQRLPRLDLFASASVTGLENSPEDAMATANDGHYNSLTVGARFSYPLGNRAARSRYERGQLRLKQSQLTLEDFELSIRQEVRRSARQLATNRKRVEASRKARYFEERKLANQQRSFELGLATNYDVLEYQQDLSTAQTNEIRALIDYHQSLLDYYYAQGTLLEMRTPFDSRGAY